MITYIDKLSVVQVKLDKRIVGEIRHETHGWRYFPKGDKKGGRLFQTLTAVKESLETE